MKQRHIIVLSISIIMIAVWYILLVQPTRQKYAKINTDLYDSYTQIKDFKKIMMTAPEFYKKHDRIKQQQLHLSSQLYSKENLLSLFDELENRAKSNNLNVIEFTPSVEELLRLNQILPDENKPQTLNIVIRLDGRLIDIGTFVKGIESESFYQGVDFCNISNSLDGKINSNFTFGFKAVLGTIRKQ